MAHFEPQIDRTRVRFSQTQRVSAEPEAVFPLLCPVREHEWLPSWRCEVVYTESGVAEEGCIFQTDREADGGLDTWVISRHEPSQRVSFVRINPLRVIQYDIRLTPEPDGSTTLHWEQTITALSDAGDRHVAALREEEFVAMIKALEPMIEHYLTTGEAVRALPS